MYRISTGDARTDLYGINKGAAQVLDLSPLREQAKLAEHHALAKKDAEAKKGEARNLYAQSQLKQLYKGDVLPAEQKYFAGEVQKIRDNVIKKMGTTGYISPEDTMDAESQIANLMQRTEISKNYREDLEGKIRAVETQGKHKFRSEDVDALHNAYNRFTPEDVGSNYKPVPLHQSTDYMQEVVKPVLDPIAKGMTQQTGRKHEFNLDEAKQLIATNLQDPHQFEDAAYKFNKTPAQQRAGAKDPVEWYQNMYAPELVRNNTTPAPVGRGSGSGGNQGVFATYDENTREATFQPKSNINSPIDFIIPKGEKKPIGISSLKVKYDDKGEVIGAEAVTFYTPEQKIIAQKNKEKEEKFNSALFKARQEEAKIKTWDKDSDSFKNAMKKIELMLPDGNDPEFKLEKLPPETVAIDAETAKKYAFNRNKGLRLKDIPKGTQEGVEVQRIGKSQHNWEYNGQSASESEWIKNGWTVEQLQKHAKKQ